MKPLRFTFVAVLTLAALPAISGLAAAQTPANDDKLDLVIKGESSCPPSIYFELP